MVATLEGRDHGMKEGTKGQRDHDYAKGVNGLFRAR
jgi:hypothetical protein